MCAAVCIKKEKRSIKSDHGPPGAAACWDRSQNARGRGDSYGKKEFFPTTAGVDGQLQTARANGSFSGKKKKVV